MASSDLTCYLRIQEWVFFGCTVPPDSKETEFGNINQEVFPSACKNTGVVLAPCSNSYFRRFRYRWVSWVLLITTDKFSVRVIKITSGIGVYRTQSLLIFISFWLTKMVILWKVRKPDNFESLNSLKISFANIQGLHFDIFGCEPFLNSNSPDI